jgi:hypothetical protein
MNSLLLHRLVKVAPFAMSVFSMLVLLHGVHVNGDPGGNTGPNIHLISNGDPGGNTGPNLQVITNGDPGGNTGPN